MASRKRRYNTNKTLKRAHKPVIKGGDKPCHTDIVVARYTEKLDWLKPLCGLLNAKGIIYNKGSDMDPINSIPIVKLENLGRESHTYLYHVIKNYDTLADITLFLPGSVKTKTNKVNKASQLDQLINKLKEGRDSYIIGNKNQKNLNNIQSFTINQHSISNNGNKLLNPNSALNKSPDRPLGVWFNKFFPGESIRCLSKNGIMAVKRDDIHKRSKKFYEGLLENVSTKNPETVHYTERVWSSIFSIPVENCI